MDQKEEVFDYKKHQSVDVAVWTDYLLKGKIENTNDSFMIISEMDVKGNPVDLSAHPYLPHMENPRLIHLADPFKTLFSAQWFARVSYNEPITVISNSTRYVLRLPHHQKLGLDAFVINNEPWGDSLFCEKPFVVDKFFLDELLVSSLTAKELDSVVRDVYKNRLAERDFISTKGVSRDPSFFD
ncbi:MAG: hypothetical protein KC535_04495 [Nanoarchaeota archaeon]|nr:hypothetical protein [Nanoarchaeota archaeon]